MAISNSRFKSQQLVVLRECNIKVHHLVAQLRFSVECQAVSADSSAEEPVCDHLHSASEWKMTTSIYSGSGDRDNGTTGECQELNSVVECDRCFMTTDTPTWMLHTHALVLVAIITVTLVGNVLIAVLLLKFKKLRHKTAMLSLNVILANTMVIFTYHFPAVVSSLSKQWQFDFIGCQITGYLSFDIILTRWLTLAVLAIDRFCVVRFPFSYQRFRKFSTNILLLISWVLPIVFTACTLFGDANIKFRDNIPTCLLYAPPNQTIYFAVVFSTSFLLGGVMPIVLYVWLLNKARKIRRSVLRVESSVNPNPNSASERTLFVSFGFIFTAFCLTGILMYLFRVIRSLSFSTWCSIPIFVHFAVVDFFLSSTAVDPFLILRDRDFRKRLRHFLCCHNNCGKYYSNRSNIHPEIPPERDFDAVRTVMVKALNLVSVTSIRESSPFRSEGSSVPHHHRPRSSSAPAAYLSHALGPLYIPQLSNMLEESERESITREGDCQQIGLSSWLHVQREAARREGDCAHLDYESSTKIECVRVAFSQES